MSRYVDAHCHLDLFDRPDETLTEAAAKGVVTVAVSQLPSGFKRLRAQLGRNTDWIRFALGVHPLKATELTTLERQLFRRHLAETDYVGEIGLDYGPKARNPKEQRRILEWILSQPSTTSKVLTVHSRGAANDTVAILGASSACAVALHWYTGPVGVAEEALEAGFYFSVNAAMTRSRKGRKLLDRIPRQRIITETDGPFTTDRGVPNGPTMIPVLVDDLARRWNGTHADTAGELWMNMTRLYQRANTSS